MADTDGNGVLSIDDINKALKQVAERYPQISIYLKRQTFRDLLKDAHPEEDMRDAQVLNNMEISIADFEACLSKVDSQMKAFPATAQVASQQGAYLANCFNKMPDSSHLPEGPPKVVQKGRHEFQPFQYRHLGQFAPLGSGQAGVELPGDWVHSGRSTQWLWYSVYLSKQVSWRTRFLVLFDWTKRAIFGRDSSRI